MTTRSDFDKHVREVFGEGVSQRKRDELWGLLEGWRPIETAPKDGSKFWGNVDEDAIAMFWHEGFGEFVSSFRRLTMAEGYTIDGASCQDHSPEIHKPTHWMPRLSPPQDPE